MQNPVQQRLEALVNVELMEAKPIFTGHLHTDGDRDMIGEIWIEIMPEDKTEDLRVSN